MYDGPGKFCPECGEALTPDPPSVTPTVAPTPPVEPRAAERTNGVPTNGVAPLPRESARPAASKMLTRIAIVAIGAGAVALGFGLTGRFTTPAVRVCDSTLTARAVADIVGAYAGKAGVPMSRFGIGPAAAGDGCDVRFWIAPPGNDAAQTVANDGIVAVVHPENPVRRLSQSQVRDIFSGRVTDWSQVGGRHDAIHALLPGDDSDEFRFLSATLLRGVTISPRVDRMSSNDIVRSIAGASGRRDVGIVGFGAASPARVIALGSGSIPSAVSIIDHRYPWSVRVLVGSDRPKPSSEVAELIAFARSGDGQSLIVRSGLLSAKGF